MSLVAIDRRELGVVNFQDQEKKKDGIMVRDFSGFFRADFHGKEGWAHDEKGGERLGLHTEMERVEFSSESSSIGGCSNSTADDGDNDEDEVQSRFRSPLGDMDSLEDSLPIKRGLSNFFSGKAKSFGCLSDAISAKDLAKTENPLNKRRRLLLAGKSDGGRSGLRGSLCAFSTQSLLEEKVVEEEEEDLKDNSNYDDDEEERECISPLPQRRKFRNFISPRSYSLSDIA